MYEHVVRTDGTCGDVPVGFFPAVPPRIGTSLGSTPCVGEEGTALVGDGACDVVKGACEVTGTVETAMKIEFPCVGERKDKGRRSARGARGALSAAFCCACSVVDTIGHPFPGPLRF